MAKSIINEMKLLSSIFESSLDAKVIVTKSGKIHRANKAADHLFSGKADADVVGKNLYKLVSRGSKIRLKTLFKRSLVEGEMHEEVSLKLGGEVKVLDVTVNTSFVKGLHLFIFRDITQRVAERESGNKFIAIAGHELKTPLAVISAYTDLLKRKCRENTTLVKYLNKISDKNRVLADYIDSIMDQIKIGTGKFTYDDKEYDFDLLVRNIIGELKQAYPESEIILRGKSKKKIKVDEERLSQVVRNLVVNAIKHSPTKGSITVDIKDSKSRVFFSVSDMGKGIAIAEQPYIFNAFYRSKKQSSSSGLGLGLYISKQIVKKYGGEINVISRRGEGAKFYFKLPAI